MEDHFDLIKKLLDQVKSKTELTACMKDLNPSVEQTYRECCDLYFNPELYYDPIFELKIESVTDFLHEELNTGHWSEVPLSVRQAFSGANFIRTLVVLTRGIKNAEDTLADALRCIDTGLLLGAPFDENYDLLTQTAALITCELNKIKETSLDHQLIKKRKSCNDHKEAYELVKGSEIVTLQCPSIESFSKTYFAPQVPVKLQDCMLHWPASKKWLDVNYLLKIAGNRTVPIEIGSHYADQNWTQQLMVLKEYIRNHYLGDSKTIGYLAQHNLFDQIPELKEDIRIPEYCALSRDYENSKDPDINAWFGPEGTVSPLHFDPKDNLLAQVYGTKQILLYSPSDSEYLYPHEGKLLFNTAQVDPMKPDPEKYPRFNQAKPYKCLLEAGEMLYIPLKWWHHVTALDKSFSVSFWWK